MTTLRSKAVGPRAPRTAGKADSGRMVAERSTVVRLTMREGTVVTVVGIHRPPWRGEFRPSAAGLGGCGEMGIWARPATFGHHGHDFHPLAESSGRRGISPLAEEPRKHRLPLLCVEHQGHEPRLDAGTNGPGAFEWRSASAALP